MFVLTKNNSYSILIVVLSVLLAISLIAGVTFAWFYSDAFASYRLTLGDPVTIIVVDKDNNPTDNLDVRVAGQSQGTLLPGKPIEMNARAVVEQSNTPAIVRARVEVELTGGSGGDIATLNQRINNSVLNLINQTNNWIFVTKDVVNEVTQETESDGGWWYYIENNLNIGDNETELHRIHSNESDYDIDFIVGTFNFPTDLGNDYANAEINFTVVFQALQGWIADPDVPTEDLQNPGVDPYIKNKIKYVQPIFHYAFGDGKYH